MPQPPATPSLSSTAITVIGPGIEVRGEITGSPSIEVRGTFEGVAGTEKTLKICEGGRVKGEIAAAQVIVEGQLDGKISAEDRVELRPTGKIKGEIETTRLVVAEGAFFDGQIRMKKP